jgi:hypothetical protein
MHGDDWAIVLLDLFFPKGKVRDERYVEIFFNHMKFTYFYEIAGTEPLRLRRQPALVRAFLVLRIKAERAIAVLGSLIEPKNLLECKAIPI